MHGGFSVNWILTMALKSLGLLRNALRIVCFVRRNYYFLKPIVMVSRFAKGLRVRPRSE